MKQRRNGSGTRKQAAHPDAVEFLDHTFGREADWEPLVERARVNRDVAHAICDLRSTHGLTQQQLADLVGTRQPVIARLEHADYEGHSLTMLCRIAAALRYRVKVEFVPLADRPPRTLRHTAPATVSRHARSAPRKDVAGVSARKAGSVGKTAVKQGSVTKRTGEGRTGRKASTR